MRLSLINFEKVGLNDIAPKSSLMLCDFASGFCFSNKVCGQNPWQFQFLLVGASQPTWQGHWTTNANQV
jgi:hypothetical protein